MKNKKVRTSSWDSVLVEYPWNANIVERTEEREGRKEGRRVSGNWLHAMPCYALPCHGLRASTFPIRTFPFFAVLLGNT